MDLNFGQKFIFSLDVHTQLKYRIIQIGKFILDQHNVIIQSKIVLNGILWKSLIIIINNNNLFLYSAALSFLSSKRFT